MQPTEHPGWQALNQHAKQMQQTHLKQLFAENPQRFAQFSARQGALLMDFSKQRIDQHTLALLAQLAEECNLEQWKDQLFKGASINTSENRPALHTALRQPLGNTLSLEGVDILSDIHANLHHMGKIVARIHAGQWRGYSGQPIDTVVNIGVGGSDLGPLMTCKALEDFRPTGIAPLTLHFVSSMDGSQLANLLDELNPATTLFVISSKSFTTIDTLSNAETARDWLRSASGVPDTLLHRRHFVGISANAQKMREWGIPVKSQLHFWEWTGGRYSLWSAIGLPIALLLGMPGFEALLAGAHSMDTHFREAPFAENLPTLMAMIGVWNINFLNIHAHAILPYDGRLKHLPAYLEQLEMESNGKSASRNGDTLDYHTCPILWGEVGPNAQHAFYQLLHQGTESVMCDFIAPARRYQTNATGLQQQHTLTLANCLAQARLLALGDSVLADNVDTPSHLRYRGNQPSTTLLLDELTPFTFGQLIALYEHKVFVQSVIWNINPFDQWGVELGKQIATSLLAPLNNPGTAAALDSSTQGLLDAIHAKQENGK